METNMLEADGVHTALAQAARWFREYEHGHRTKGADEKADRNRDRALYCETAPSFQARVAQWMSACFGARISADLVERNHRFLEEALELVQANGCTASEAHQLVEYVFGRPVGDPQQEAGGVMVTLAALCAARGIEMDVCGDLEIARCWTKVDQIRAKQAAKPQHSPLPGPTTQEHSNG